MSAKDDGGDAPLSSPVFASLGELTRSLMLLRGIRWLPTLSAERLRVLETIVNWGTRRKVNGTPLGYLVPTALGLADTRVH